MTTTIVGLDGKAFVPPPPVPAADPAAPIPELIALFEDLLARAKAGEIRSLVGCGLTAENKLYTLIADGPVKSPESYAILGGIDILRTCYGEMILMAVDTGDESDAE